MNSHPISYFCIIFLSDIPAQLWFLSSLLRVSVKHEAIEELWVCFHLSSVLTRHQSHFSLNCQLKGLTSTSLSCVDLDNW